MAERSRFPFSVQYREDGGVMIAEKVRIHTLYGPVVLRRH